MDPKNLLIAQSVETALRGITTQAGYFTDLGNNVARGFYAQGRTDRNNKYPLVTIQPAGETVRDTQQTTTTKFMANLSLVIVTDDTTTPTDTLYRCVSDVRRALAITLVEELQAQKVVHLPPEFGAIEYGLEPRSSLALATVVVAIPFVEKYEATT